MWEEHVYWGYHLTCIGAFLLFYEIHNRVAVEIGLLWLSILLFIVHNILIVIWYLLLNNIPSSERLWSLTLACVLGTASLSVLNSEFDFSEPWTVTAALIAGISGTLCKIGILSFSDSDLNLVILLECIHPIITYSLDVFVLMDSAENPLDIVGCLCILLGWIVSILSWYSFRQSSFDGQV
jgi:hypothetical protein